MIQTFGTKSKGSLHLMVLQPLFSMFLALRCLDWTLHIDLSVHVEMQPQTLSGGIVPVLFIIDQLCALGGAERVLLRIIDHLPRDRYAPRVVTFALDETLGVEKLLQCPLHVYPLRRTYGREAFGVVRQIRDLIRSHDIQIAHTFHPTSDLWAGVIAKLSGCRILISSRRDMGLLRTGKHHFAYRLLGRYFDEVQTVSDEVRRFCIVKDRLDPGRVVTVYNGIDMPQCACGRERGGIRARLGLEDGVRAIVSVGNIRRIKGFDVFIRAAAKVHAAIPQVVFAIAGEEHDRSYGTELRELVGSLGLGSSFVFLGGVDDVHSLLQSADIFCLPSRSEGLSNALLEAMACELPCVVTRVGGNPEVVVDGKTGYIVENEDAESAAAAMLELLRNPSAARRMGAEGRRVVQERFTTEAMIQTLVNSYERLLVSGS